MTASTERGPFVSLSDDLGALVTGLGPRVVSVFARGGRPSNGFVFDDGLVLTPAHAVHRDHDLTIRTAEGTRDAATLAGSDDATNVAVLKAASLAGQGPVEAADDPRPGHLLVALARHPDGTPLAALTMVQRAGGRLRAWRGQAHDRVLQLDRGLPPTFAGAPLLDPRGRLAGMVLAGELRAAGLAAGGIGVLGVARTVARDGGVARGFLGVVCQGVRLTGAQVQAAGTPAGLLVAGVTAEGAAAGAGVLVGDVILRFDEQPLGDAEELHARLTRERAGAVHRLTLLRGQSVAAVEVTLRTREGRG